MILSKQIINNIKKYIFKKSVLNNLPNEIKYSILRYDLKNLIKYFVNKNIEINWKIMYYFLFHESKTEFEYAFPINYNNEWLNAIVNRSTKNIPNNFKIIKGGKLIVRGENNYGKLGLGDQDEVGENRTKFELVPNIKNVVNVFCGSWHTIILLKNATIMSCGLNDCGQLGFGDKKDRNKFELVKNIKDVVNVFYGNGGIIILLKNGTIMSCGYNEDGQLGLGDEKDRTKFESVPNVKNVVNVFCGYYNTIILLKNGTIMSCGSNGRGQLGLGDYNHRNKFEMLKDEVGKNIKNVVNVFCGYYSTFLLLKNRTIMSCGYNEDGQLGLGDRDNRTKFELVKDEVGKNIKNVINVSCSSNNTKITLKSGQTMETNAKGFFKGKKYASHL